MKISKETIFAISDEFMWGFDNDEMTLGKELPGGRDAINPNKLTPDNIDSVYKYICDNTTEIWVAFDKDFANGKPSVYYGLHFRPPKNKEVTLDYIYNKLYKAKNPVKINSYEIFKKFGEKNKIPAEPTTFGYSLYIMFGAHQKAKERTTEILKNTGIAFKEQNSLAGWCYNWVISKKKENLDLIKESNNHVKTYDEWKL